MEAANQKRLLSFKISFLEEQRDQLHAVVDDYVNKVLHIGKTWTEGREAGTEGKALTYRELSQLIEDAAMHVTQKCAELSGDSSSQVPSIADPSAVEATPLNQLTANHSESSVELESLKSALTRITVLEEAVSSLSGNVNKVLERQSDMEKGVENMTIKQSEMEKERETHLRKMEKELDTLQSDVQQMNTDIGYMESYLNYDKQIDTLTEKMKTLETLDKKFEILKQKVVELETFGERINKLETMGFEEHDILSEEIQNLKQGEPERLVAVEEELDKFKLTMDLLSSEVENEKLSLQNLTRSVDASRQDFQEIRQGQERDAERQQEVHDRLTEMERRELKTVERLEKKYEDVELKYKMVCQIVADRLAPLEQLRDIFNKNIERRDENIEKLNDVVRQVAALVPKVSQLECHYGIQAVGFSARLNRIVQPVKGDILNKLTDVLYNAGGHFDPQSGLFTAPVDGIYGVCLSMWQMNEGQIRLQVQRGLSTNRNQRDQDTVVHCKTPEKGSSCCGCTVIELKAGDLLYISVACQTEHAMLFPNRTQFSCFLIK